MNPENIPSVLTAIAVRVIAVQQRKVSGLQCAAWLSAALRVAFSLNYIEKQVTVIIMSAHNIIFVAVIFSSAERIKI